MHLNSKKTIIAIANATELATAIVHKVMGNEIANTLSGSTLSKSALGNLMALRIQSKFSKYTKNYGENK